LQLRLRIAGLGISTGTANAGDQGASYHATLPDASRFKAIRLKRHDRRHRS